MQIHGRGARLTIALLAAVAGAAGCASVLGIDSDRHLVSSGDGGGSPLVDAAGDDVGTPGDAAAVPDAGEAGESAAFSCLADPVPTAPTGNVHVEFFFNDVSGASNGGTGSPVAGAEVHACNALDVTCANSFGSQTTNDAGLALLSVPGGFDGYYEVHATNYTPGILYRTRQFASEFQGQGMANITLLSAGASLAGVTQDPNLSIAIVTAEDCTTTPSAGIVFTVGGATANEQVVYLANNYPSQGATETDVVSGSALVFNVPAGTLNITASFADTQKPIRTISTIARQGWVTLIQIRPDQAVGAPIDGGP